MPLIEVLPGTSTVRPSHGWTYVADTAGAPSLPAAATAPSRKRARISEHPGGTTASSAAAAGGAATGTAALSSAAASKQSKAVLARLADLNRENHRDAHIALPKRAGATDKTRAKTQNVRRILAYNRTFAHYLADEEAGVQVYPHLVGTNQNTKPDPRRRSGVPVPASSSSAADSHPSAGKGGARNKHPPPPATGTATSTPAAPTASSPSNNTHPQPPSTSSNDNNNNKPQEDLDQHPLLRTTNLPRPPTQRVMAALLAEPPLSWSAARAPPLEDRTTATAPAASGPWGSTTLKATPARVFCGVCGYWGKVRCRWGCGERACGLLECVRGHEAVCVRRAAQY